MFPALSSGLFWTGISAVEEHSIANKKFTDSNTFVVWHDGLGHPRSIIMRQIIKKSNGHRLKDLKNL